MMNSDCDYCSYYLQDFVDEFPCCYLEPRVSGNIPPCEYNNAPLD